MKRYFNNNKLLPATNIILICVLLACMYYTDYVGKIFLGICVLAQCVCLYGIYTRNETLMGLSHIMFALTILVGTFLGRKMINYILMVLIIFVMWTRYVRGSCMYDDHTTKYMDKIPLNSKGIDIFFGAVLLMNIYYIKFGG